MRINILTSARRSASAIWIWWQAAPFALKLGSVLTYYWVFGIVAYSIWKADRFAELKPNEFGDALAGGFAPLAFLWLLVAVLLQKQELELQRDELHESRKALEAQASETRSLVTENRRSVEFAQQDLEYRRNYDEQNRLSVEIDMLQQRLRAKPSYALLSDQYKRIDDFAFGFSDPGSIDIDIYTREASMKLSKLLTRFEGRQIYVSSIESFQYLEDIVRRLDRIHGEIRENHLSAWARFQDLNLPSLHEQMTLLVATAQVRPSEDF